MIENSVEKFCNDLFLFLTGTSTRDKSLLIKKHSENLKQRGDFSYPNSTKSWHVFLDSKHVCDEINATLMDYINKTDEDLMRESQKWLFIIDKVKEEMGRKVLFLARISVYRVGLLEAMKNNISIANRLQKGNSLVLCDPICEESKCITSLRLSHLSKTIQNLHMLSSDYTEKAVRMFISYKSSNKMFGSRMILCGVVLNSKTGMKESKMGANDFIKLRQNEMTLIAQHKYGVRVSTDPKWREFIDHLGESAVTFELLQTKPSTAVKINFDCAAGSSKGAAFILYNCARLETILRTYNDKVNEGTYPLLPAFEDTDLTLLTQEDEWSLIFNFVMGFPSLLENCVEINDKVCEFRPHHICSFLSSMVRTFSQYYRKIRILTEPRQHLLPVLYARIHMLKVLNDTLKTCLSILNIKSVSQM